MKLLILSDLHNEFRAFYPPQTEAGIVVLAGDIHIGKKGIDWAKAHYSDKPVIYVIGNHEYYGRAFPKHVRDLKALAEGTNIHVLENNELTIDGAIFLGCTLWTDFKLFGDPRIAGYQATQIMTDYRKIRVSPQYRKLRSLDTAIIHGKSLRWLTEKLGEFKNNQNPVVVVTHHAPSKRSIPEHYQDDILSAAYASSLDELIEKSCANLWVHGHIHSQQYYMVGKTRVICNPRGYPDEYNESFIPDLTINI